jgi:hypothetical protein
MSCARYCRNKKKSFCKKGHIGPGNLPKKPRILFILKKDEERKRKTLIYIFFLLRICFCYLLVILGFHVPGTPMLQEVTKNQSVNICEGLENIH